MLVSWMYFVNYCQKLIVRTLYIFIYHPVLPLMCHEYDYCLDILCNVCINYAKNGIIVASTSFLQGRFYLKNNYYIVLSFQLALTANYYK